MSHPLFGRIQVLKQFHKTLRFRLTFWNTLVVLFAISLALIVLREQRRQYLVSETHDLLREEATELELAIQKLFPDLSEIKAEFQRKVLGHSQRHWFAQLVDENEEQIYRSTNFPDGLDLEDAEPALADQPFEFQSTDKFQLIEKRVEVPDGRQFVMVLGTPDVIIDESIASLTQLMLVTGAWLLVVAPIGGYFLARNATQPVRKILTTTRSLNPTHLDSRLEVRGTGDELDQLSIEINSFLDQISKYLKSHREFVENAAHELRSPLTAIQTSVEVALGKERTVTEYREELETVSEQCQQLRHLVNQLLELTETDAAIENTTFAPFDFTQLVEKSVDVFAGIAEEKEVVVHTRLQPGIVMHGDSSKIRQVCNNLLDNALKFTPQGGQIEIVLDATPQQLRFSVQDTGPGVQEAELEKIFERFYQADPSRQRDSSRGSGLGLSICKSIVEMHRGQISASPSQTGGLKIGVVLPTDARRSPPCGLERDPQATHSVQLSKTWNGITRTGMPV